MKTLKTAEELWKIKPKPFPILTSGKTLEINLMDFREFDSAITEDRQSITNKIREMIEEIKPKEKEVFYGSPEYYKWVACIGMLTNLIQWIEGGSNG